MKSYELGYKGSLFDGGLNCRDRRLLCRLYRCPDPGIGRLYRRRPAQLLRRRLERRQGDLQGSGIRRPRVLGEDLAAAGDLVDLSTALGYIDAQYKKFITNIAGVPTDVADFRRVQNTPPNGPPAARSLVSGPGRRRRHQLRHDAVVPQQDEPVRIPNPISTRRGSRCGTPASSTPHPRAAGGSMFGKNLTNKEYKTSGYTFINVNPVTGVPVIGGNGLPTSALGTEGTLTAFYGNPRQVFVTGTVKF